MAATEAATFRGRLLVHPLVGVLRPLHPRRDHLSANLPPHRFSGRQRNSSDRALRQIMPESWISLNGTVQRPKRARNDPARLPQSPRGRTLRLRVRCGCGDEKRELCLSLLAPSSPSLSPSPRWLLGKLRMGAFCMKYGRDHAKGPIRRKGGEEGTNEDCNWERGRARGFFTASFDRYPGARGSPHHMAADLRLKENGEGGRHD